MPRRFRLTSAPHSAPMPHSAEDVYARARQTMTVCAVCKYCDGFCPVFREGSALPALTDGDVDWLAALCHGCRACWPACQYAPPHPFAIAVPQTLAAVRQHQQAPVLARIGSGGRMMIAGVLSLILPLWVVGMVVAGALSPDVLFGRHQGAGAFYAVLPWGVLTGLAGGSLGLAIVATGVRVWRFWARIDGGRIAAAGWRQAVREAATLRHLDQPARRWSHHALTIGFGLCFAATAVATLYHHVWGWIAPYPLFSLPVGLGTVGGGLMLAGCAGLWWFPRRADPSFFAPVASDSPTANDLIPDRHAATAPVATGDHTLTGLLALVAGSGLALLGLRETAAMGLLLAWHLGLVMVLFLALPFGGLAHAPLRIAALLKAARAARARSDGRRDGTVFE